METNKNPEGMLKEATEHLDNSLRWTGTFSDEFDAVLYLLKARMQKLTTQMSFDSDTHDYMPENNYKEIKAKYDTLWSEVVEDLAGIYNGVSDIYDETIELKKFRLFR